MSDMPTKIHRDTVLAFIRDAGFDPDEVTEVYIGPTSVVVTFEVPDPRLCDLAGTVTSRHELEIYP